MLSIFKFVDTYSLEIFVVVFYFFMGLAVVFVFSQIRRYLTSIPLSRLVNQIVGVLVLIGQVICLLFALYLGLPVFLERGHKTFTERMKAWDGLNVVKRKPLDFTTEILATTDWVREDLTIYFISDKKLVSIRADGSDKKVVFSAPTPIREYHFSEDGASLLIVTQDALYQHFIKEQKDVLIDTLGLSSENIKKGFKGVIDGVQWAQDSKKFCYQIARWSKLSSQERWYIYDVAAKSKEEIRGLSGRVTSLTWDKQGENLYYLLPGLTGMAYVDPYIINVHRLSLKTFQSEFVMKIPSEEFVLPLDQLKEKGIDLYGEGKRLSFGRAGEKGSLQDSPQGYRIGIDKFDHLYYIKFFWWRKRLYKIPRVPTISDVPRYQYRGGELAIKHLRWLPSGRYVIMGHYFFGILILEPASAKIGILDNERGCTFGWYTPLKMIH